MKAIAATPRKKKSARLVEVPVPSVGDDEVLVRVRLCGLDGTDREIDEGLYGDPPEGEDFLVIGHESLGVVVEVGAKVRDLRPGDRVVATVRRPDSCLNCREGEYDMCLGGDYTERGIKGRHGYLSEFYVEEEKFLVKVPKSLGDRAVAMGKSVMLLMGDTTGDRIYPEHLLPPGINAVVITEDGSVGEKGMATDLLPRFSPDAEQVFACGPLPMYQRMAEMGDLLGHKPVQVILETVLGCGVGACLGCTVETVHGSRLVCKDGPVFQLHEIVWEKVVAPITRRALL